MTKLYLVRHGETVDNKAQIMQGQTPGKLNMKGIEQYTYRCFRIERSLSQYTDL